MALWSTVPPQFTPPHDGRPAQLGTLLDGYAQRHEVTATLLDVAVRGFLRGAAPSGLRPHELRPYEQRLLDAFFADGNEVGLSELQDRFGAI